MLCVLYQRARVLKMKAKLRDGDEIFIHHMNGRARKDLILVTVSVTNFKEKYLDLIKNTTTDTMETAAEGTNLNVLLNKRCLWMKVCQQPWMKLCLQHQRELELSIDSILIVSTVLTSSDEAVQICVRG